MKIGLYFGSFNPIHNGHLIIANQLYEKTGVDEVWIIPSPQNPFKKTSDLLDFNHRYEMIQEVIKDTAHIKVSDIENSLSKPSFTIQTINALQQQFPEHQFEIFMGSDNLESLHLWKNYEELLQKCKMHVYVRNTSVKENLPQYQNVEIHHLPILDISSTAIRLSIKEGKSIIGEVDSKISDLIVQNRWYL